MYTTQLQVESKLGSTLTDQQVAYFNGVVDKGIDTQINTLTGTKFGSDDVVSVYVEAEPYSSTLVIPTMHDITSVSLVDSADIETALPVDTYTTYPRGEVNKFALRMHSGCWKHDRGYAYKITGKLGFDEIPADIAAVATEMAVNSIKAGSNEYKSEKVGDWAVTYADGNDLSADSSAILAGYKRLSRSI